MFRTKPDLHITRDGDAIVLDTKWKHIDPRRTNYDVTQADAYQMHGYAHLYRTRSAVLLYPHHRGIGDQAGLQKLWRFEAGEAQLGVATVDVANPNEFPAMLRLLLAKQAAA